MMHAQDSLEMGYDDVASSSVQQHQQQRTIQWRIALGILSSISSNTNNNTNNKAKQEKEEEDNWSHQLATQRAQYAQLVQQYPYPTTTTTDQEDDNDDGDDDGIVVAGAAADSKNNNKDDDDDFLDPLTAMYMQEKQQSDRLQQRELQYRKEKARRKRGFAVSSASSNNNNKDYEDESLTEQELQAVGLQIIDKDLARLPHPDSLHGTSVCCSFRKDILRQVLFLYQCTTTTAATTTAAVSHNHCGYQQGMHEIASYVLYALELERETSSLSDQSIYADTYTMVQVILTQLLPAYDVEVAPAPTTTTTEKAGDDDDDNNNNRNASPRQQQTNHSKTITTTTRTTTTTTTKHHHHHHNKPLEQMGQRILQQLAQHDPVLYQMWMSSSLASIPPQLIFTKWIRLLFSREVTNVLGLWDVLFGQMQQHGVSLQQVAETVAVARLLMHRTILLEKHYQHHQAHSTTTTTTTRGSGGSSSSSSSSNSDLLHYLMNMPVEESIQPLIQLLPPMLRGESVAAFLPPAPTMTTAAAAAATPSSSSTTTRVGATLTQAFQSMKTTVNAQHHPLVSTTTPLFRTPENVVDAGGLSRFSLSNVTEKLASQTQSIGKRLQQEWEQLAQQHQQQQQRQLHHHLHHPLDNDQLRNYDDPPPRPTWDNNNDNNTQDDPYAAVIPPAAQGHAPQPQQFLLSPLADGGGGGGGGMTPSSPSRRLLGQFGISPNQQLAQQMQKPLSVLQHFAMQVQRDQRHVPDQVWEALASLEVVRTKLGQS